MGIPGEIAQALKGALGMGMAGVQSAAEGLGLAQPQQQPGMFGAPAQYQPTDFSDMNALQQIALRFQNAVASGEGQGFGAASGKLREQRAAGNKQRTEAFNQGLKMLQDFDAIRDKASPADYDRVNAMLRKRFAEVAGGQPGDADMFYDSFMSGGAGNTAGLLKLAQQDPAIAQLIDMGGSVADIRAALKDKIKDGIVLGDTEELEKDRAALRELMAGGDLELRAKLEKARLEGGGFDLDTALGILGDKLSASQRARLKRHEMDLVGEGFVLGPELAKRRDSGHSSALQQEEDAARIQAQLDANIKLAEKEAELGKYKPRIGGKGGRILQHQWNAANYGKRMEQASAIMATEQYNRAAMSAGIQRHLPNMMRSSDFQLQEQAERNFLNAILRKESGAVISESEFANGETQYFPRAGDSPQVVEQKRANREQALASLKAEAGDAWDQIPSVAPRKQDGSGAAAGAGEASAETSESILQDLRAGKITRDQARVKMEAWKAAHGAQLQTEAAGGR